MDGLIAFDVMCACIASVLVVVGAVVRARRGATRGKAQRQFDKAVNNIANGLRKAGAKVETIESTFDGVSGAHL